MEALQSQWEGRILSIHFPNPKKHLTVLGLSAPKSLDKAPSTTLDSEFNWEAPVVSGPGHCRQHGKVRAVLPMLSHELARPIVQ